MRFAYLDINAFFNTRLPLDAALLPVALAAGFAQAVEDNLKVPVHEALWSFLQRLHLNVGFETPEVGGLALSVSASVRDDVSFAARARDAFHEPQESSGRVPRLLPQVLSRLDPTKSMVFIVDSIDHWRGAGDQFEPVRESVGWLSPH